MKLPPQKCDAAETPTFSLVPPSLGPAINTLKSAR